MQLDWIEPFSYHPMSYTGFSLDPRLGTVDFYCWNGWPSISMVSAPNLGEEIISDLHRRIFCRVVSRSFDDTVALPPPITSWRASRYCFVSKDL
jgi:hypothetical protein